jgi:hypothetical protein
MLGNHTTSELHLQAFGEHIKQQNQQNPENCKKHDIKQTTALRGCLFTLQDLKQEGKTTLFNLSWECVHS